MNYYPHHIGDFNNATRHLTRVERALYRELIELYYDTEQPLPARNMAWVCKKVGAVEKEDIETVLCLIREFFYEEGDLWRNKRCDEEIASYRAKQEAAVRAGKASAEARNKRSTSVQRAFNQPITNNQEPRTRSKNIVGLRPDALQVLEFLNSKTGRHYEPVPANLEMIAARLKEGSSVDDLRAVVAKKCREWAGDEKMAQYLRPATLFNRTKFAQYKGELVNADSVS